MRRKRIVAAVAAGIAATALAAAAAAAQPTSQRIEIDDAGLDTEASAACGFPVTFTAQGFVIVRSFADDGKGLVQLNTISVDVTLSANGNTVRARDVGADHLRIAPDGTAILSIIGQLPFDFNGVLKLDLDTGEVLHEPHHFEDIADACAALAA